MRTKQTRSAVFMLACVAVIGAAAYTSAAGRKADIPETGLAQKPGVYIRTENFPRPPYSGATYYIYERDGKTICTKLEVCNKFDECTTTYKKGTFKGKEDVETGDPYGKTDSVLIAPTKLRKHTCLTKFRLIP
jgi:hypothetical protein